MIEDRNSQQAKIRSGTPKHNPVCYQTVRDIVIPAGSIMRANGEPGVMEILIGFGEFSLTVSVPESAGALASGYFKRVIA